MPRIGQHLSFAKKIDFLRNMDKQNHTLLGGDSPFGGKPALDRTAFMNNICSCLDSCSAYIQALNSLCAAGTVLAHSLLQVFQELPPYRDLAEQFVTTWEEMSKATAGASSGVKTETLMALQEVLNRLEEENSTINGSKGSVHNKSVMDNIKAVGSCLLSYVELQAQFSLSCWKSLSQISKNSESLIFFCLPREFQDPSGHGGAGFDPSNTSALIRAPNDLVVSIRKYFSQVLQNTMPNVNAASNQPPAPTMYSNYCENNESLISKPQTPQQASGVTSPNAMVFRSQQGLPPPSSNRWVHHHSLHTSISAPSSYGKIPQKTRVSSTSGDINSNKDGGSVSSELEEVLNLLSCQPNEPPPPPPPQTPPSLNANDKNSFLNNLPLVSGSLSLQSVPWCVDNPKELSTGSDSAIHTGFPYQRVSYEGKRTWPRMGAEEQSTFPLGGWAWGHPERNNVQSSSMASNQGGSANILAHQSSHKGNMVNWCSTTAGGNGSNGWSSGQADNSSSDDGSNSNNGQDNEVFYPLGSLGYTDIVIPPNTLGNRQRRHSSNDGLPDGCNNLPLLETPVEKQLNTALPWQDGTKTVKTSTWPLKQNVNSRLGLEGLLLGNMNPTSSPTPPLPLSQPPIVAERSKMLDRSDLCDNNEGCLRVASLVERWGGGMCTQSDKNKDEQKKYTLFGQLS